MNKKIFQIGFNKAATGSIYKFFLDNGIPSVHWEGGRLSKRINNNYLNGKPLLEGYEKYQGFTDMEHGLDSGGFFYVSETYFKELDQQYPNSLFIMNYRNIDSWLKSRLNHDQGRYLLQAMRGNNQTKEDICEKWKNEYIEHMKNVKEYFLDKSNLLLLDIESEDKNLLGNFLIKHGFNIKDSSLGHHHKTISNDINIHIGHIRDAAMHLETIDLSLSLKLMEVAQVLRPNGSKINSKIIGYRSHLRKNHYNK